MEITDETIDLKEALEDPLLATGQVTGIDFGVREEDEPDSEDVVLRVFVADEQAVPEGVEDAFAALGLPVVVIQRTFELAQLPDTTMHRPMVGGVSVTPERFTRPGAQTAPTGTLGAIVRHTLTPSVLGLSNHHVLCVDLNRAQGQEVIQPEPTIIGRLPGDHLGTLEDWSFPEQVESGRIDAAICSIDVPALTEVAELGPVVGSNVPFLGMPVRKRGRSTGPTSGTIEGIGGSFPIDYPLLPPVGSPPSIVRVMKRQIHIRPAAGTTAFGTSGDSGSVVVDEGNRAVGLYFASTQATAGAPRFGLASPIQFVEQALSISFEWPAPFVEEVPDQMFAFDTATIRGSGFLLASDVLFDDVPAESFSVDGDDSISVVPPDFPGDRGLVVTGPGGASDVVTVSLNSIG
jgi:hypothetical protein